MKYVVDSQISPYMPRSDVDKSVVSKFEVINNVDVGTCGNIQLDCEDLTLVELINSTKSPLWLEISSHLALYRLQALFPGSGLYPHIDTYKCVWQMNFRHLPTNEEFSFYDYKGYFRLGLRYLEVKDVPDSFKTDLLDLIKLILNVNMTTEYDGVVAGSVA